MPHLYVTSCKKKLGFRSGALTISNGDNELEQEIPLNTIEGISVFGQSQLTTQLVRRCLQLGIPVMYYSSDGHYFGHISSFNRIDPSRQKKQILLTDDSNFCISWSRMIVAAKIMNSISFINSLREKYDFSSNDMYGMEHSLEFVQQAQSVEEIMGYEGNAAKSYFFCLSLLLDDEELSIEGRSARPPRDPVNSMLSYGYSLLYRNILGAIERHGLHPYFAFMHKSKFGHAALASDLIEEYRVPIVDSAVLELIYSGEFGKEDFNVTDKGAVYMTRPVQQRLTSLLGDAIVRREQYFADSGDDRVYGFQVMLDKKINELIAAIEHKDISYYRPYIYKPNNDE